MNETCKLKPAHKKHKDDTRARRFRNTAAWQRKRAEIQERDNYLCKVCLTRNTITYDSTEVHHIEPLEERYDLRLDDDNLITLCGEDHIKAEKGTINRQVLRALAKSEVPPLP